MFKNWKTIFGALAIAAWMAFADRSWGGGLSKWDKDGDGIKLAAVPAILGLLFAVGFFGVYLGAWTTLALPAGVLALGWGIYRSLPFKDGAGCPRPNQRLSALLRHIAAFPIFLLTAAFRQQDGDVKAILTIGVAYCLIAAAIAIGYGVVRDKREAAGRGVEGVNTYVELVRGAAYGLAAWGCLVA
jgi:hypothetical protein